MNLHDSLYLVILHLTLQQIIAQVQISSNPTTLNITDEIARKLDPENGKFKVLQSLDIPGKQYAFWIRGGNDVQLICTGHQNLGIWSKRNYIISQNNEQIELHEADLDQPVTVTSNTGTSFTLVFSDILPPCSYLYRLAVNQKVGDRTPGGSEVVTRVFSSSTTTRKPIGLTVSTVTTGRKPPGSTDIPTNKGLTISTEPRNTLSTHSTLRPTQYTPSATTGRRTIVPFNGPGIPATSPAKTPASPTDTPFWLTPSTVTPFVDKNTIPWRTSKEGPEPSDSNVITKQTILTSTIPRSYIVTDATEKTVYTPTTKRAISTSTTPRRYIVTDITENTRNIPPSAITGTRTTTPHPIVKPPAISTPIYPISHATPPAHPTTPKSKIPYCIEDIPDSIEFTNRYTNHDDDHGPDTPFRISLENCKCTCPNTQKIPRSVLKGQNFDLL